MFPTSVDRLLREIANFKNGNSHLTSQMKDQVQNLQMELGFLKTFIWCSQHESLRKYCIGAATRIGKTKLRLRSLDGAVSISLQEIELCKQKIRDDGLCLLDFSNQSKFSSTYELLQFLNSTLCNLCNLVLFKPDATVAVRPELKVLIEKLGMIRYFVNCSGEKFFFSLDIQVWACRITILSVLYWVDQMEETMAARVKAILIDLIVNSYDLRFVALYRGVVNASNLGSSPKVMKLFLGLRDSSEAFEYMNIIRADLKFLIAWFVDPQKFFAEEVNLISTKATEVVTEIPSLIRSLTLGEMNANIVEERNVLFPDFREKVDRVKAEVRNFVQNHESFWDYFSLNKALALMDSPLESFVNLMTLISKAIHISYATDEFVTLHIELHSLLPFLKKIQEEDLMDIWMRVSEVACRVENVIFWFSREHSPMWYNVLLLSDVIEGVKFIKRHIQQMIKHKQRHTNRILNANVNFGNIHLDRRHTDDVVIGFKDDTEKIINRLIGGLEKLAIVPIVGMPGQGKTTLARKVYKSRLVRLHFNICAWCFVTQVYEVETLLLNILRVVISKKLDNEIHMSAEDLAHKLSKCLRGRRYLIILDDIWDITAWNSLRESFPDDNNGSRILFTSRNKFGFDPYPLGPLSKKESMELLRRKLCLEDGWASYLSLDLQKILKMCNGLPLALVVVAGLLKSVSNNLDKCRELVRSLDSKLASEGCIDILELSYNNLPDHLKPCFLYLGAVVEQSKVSKVERLIQLWIAEGFVQKTELNSLEDVAIEYLEALIGRSLVIVNKRSFTNGEIKECRVHDLLQEFCLRKAAEERLLYFLNADSYSLKPINCKAPCLRFDSGWMANPWAEKTGEIEGLVPTKITSPIIRSLLFPVDILSSLTLMIKFVRVLDISGFELDYGHLEEIVSLICLIYLSISAYTLDFIPPSINKLRNLECFLIRCNNVFSLPSTIWKMKTLKNINVVSGVYMDLDATLGSKLDNLDSFSSLHLTNVEDAENLLRGFPKVRKLKLKFIKDWECRRDCDQFQVLKSLSKLEALNLRYFTKVKHTCAFYFPTTLKQLSLSHFSHPLSAISTIGKLPNLKVLKLLYPSSQVQSWDIGEEEFVNLKYLKLIGFDISHWEVPTSSFLSLDRLVVRSFLYLVELPSSFEDVLTLQMIELHSCRKSLGNSAMSILSAQRDMGNEELEVLISSEIDTIAQQDMGNGELEVLISNEIGTIAHRDMGNEELEVLISDEIDTIPQQDMEKEKLEVPISNEIETTAQQEEPQVLLSLYYSILSALADNSSDEFGSFTASPSMYSFTFGHLRRQHQKRRLLEKKISYETHYAHQRRLLKHNCQPRQAIMSRQYKEQLKRDG